MLVIERKLILVLILIITNTFFEYISNVRYCDNTLKIKLLVVNHSLFTNQEIVA